MPEHNFPAVIGSQGEIGGPNNENPRQQLIKGIVKRVDSLTQNSQELYPDEVDIHSKKRKVDFDKVYNPKLPEGWNITSAVRVYNTGDKGTTDFAILEGKDALVSVQYREGSTAKWTAPDTLLEVDSHHREYSLVVLRRVPISDGILGIGRKFKYVQTRIAIGSSTPDSLIMEQQIFSDDDKDPDPAWNPRKRYRALKKDFPRHDALGDMSLPVTFGKEESVTDEDLATISSILNEAHLAPDLMLQALAHMKESHTVLTRQEYVQRQNESGNTLALGQPTVEAT